jgi:DNA-binding PucR family transcriptional regulator
MSIEAVIELLEMLTAEAPEADLLSGLEALRASEDTSTASADGLSRVLLRLYQSRAADRRRAVGLTVLGDTAMDLAARRDLDELLAEICRRARMLLGTDVAYITLTDGDDTFIRATDGIVSEAFRAMRIPLGAGLGGLVARSGKPAFTADYESDDRLVHLPDVDRRVGAERLRAIAAAPLRRGDEIRGVVMAGSRAVRQFDPEEVSLLASLAAHASIAIENAQLLRHSAETLEALAAAHERTRLQTQRIQRVADIVEQLASLALNGAAPDELLAALVGFLPGEVELIDGDGDGEILAVVGKREVGSDNVCSWEQPVSAGSEQLATLSMHRLQDDGIEPEVLARAAPLLASLLIARQSETEREHRHRSRVLEDLLEAREDAGLATHRLLSKAGVASDPPYVVIVVALAESAQRWGWLRATRIAADDGHGLVATVNGALVIVVPGDDASFTAKRWAERLRSHDGSPATIGAALSRHGGAPMRTAYHEAAGVLNLLFALGHGGHYATADELGIFGHMFVHQSPTDLRTFIEKMLGGLIVHGDAEASTLLVTLDAYFQQAGHLANTARALRVHINTLYGRMARLANVLGPDWQESDRRLELHLAVRLHALDRKLTDSRELAAGTRSDER